MVLLRSNQPQNNNRASSRKKKQRRNVEEFENSKLSEHKKL